MKPNTFAAVNYGTLTSINQPTRGTKPPQFSYPGGKCRQAKDIIGALPESGGKFFDVFSGRGNIFWRAVHDGLDYSEFHLNDHSTMPFFKTLWSHGHLVQVPQFGKQEYLKQKAVFLKNQSDPASILLEPYLTFSGCGYRHAGARGATKRGGVSAKTYQQHLLNAHIIMCETMPTLTALDWRKLGLHNLTANDTCVFDVPYIGCNVKTYKPWAMAEYEEFVTMLTRARFRWLLCEYEHDLYVNKLGRPFWQKDIRLLCTSGKAQRRVECMWRNF